MPEPEEAMEAKVEMPESEEIPAEAAPIAEQTPTVTMPSTAPMVSFVAVSRMLCPYNGQQTTDHRQRTESC